MIVLPALHNRVENAPHHCMLYTATCLKCIQLSAMMSVILHLHLYFRYTSTPGKNYLELTGLLLGMMILIPILVLELQTCSGWPQSLGMAWLCRAFIIHHYFSVHYYLHAFKIFQNWSPQQLCLKIPQQHVHYHSVYLSYSYHILMLQVYTVAVKWPL